MKKIFSLLLIAIILIVLMPTVNADNITANVDFIGEDFYEIGETITLTLSIKELVGINGQIRSIDGRIKYDNEYLEYVSSQNVSPFSVMKYAPQTSKIIGFAIGEEENITALPANMIEFKFIAKKRGVTSIEIYDSEITVGNTTIETTPFTKTFMITN